MRLAAIGPSPARGLLVNRTVGSRPFDPVDPGRPAVIVVHGLNPFHPVIHFTMGARYGETLGRRYGNSVQVFEWDWNAVTTTGLLSGLSANERFCEEQGRLLAAPLIASQIDPSLVSFVGQSSGVIVSVSASRAIAGRYGRPVARLTMLDPYHAQHDLIFSESWRALMRLDRRPLLGPRPQRLRHGRRPPRRHQYPPAFTPPLSRPPAAVAFGPYPRGEVAFGGDVGPDASHCMI